MTSSPGFNSTVKALCRACLAPLATTTCAGEYSRPCRARYCSTTAFLNSGMPLASVYLVWPAHGRPRRLANMGRGDEIGLAHAQIVDGLAGGLEFFGLGRHGQRGSTAPKPLQCGKLGSTWNNSASLGRLGKRGLARDQKTTAVDAAGAQPTIIVNYPTVSKWTACNSCTKHHGMAKARIGLWLIGAKGGVATTATIGLIALKKSWIGSTGLVSQLPQFEHLDLATWDLLRPRRA